MKVNGAFLLTAVGTGSVFFALGFECSHGRTGLLVRARTVFGGGIFSGQKRVGAGAVTSLGLCRTLMAVQTGIQEPCLSVWPGCGLLWNSPTSMCDSPCY